MTSMSLSVVGVVILTSMTPIPIIYFLKDPESDHIQDRQYVLPAAIVSFLGAAILPGIYMRRFFRNIDPIIYVCACFSWSSVVNLLIGLELDGIVSGYIGYYFLEGEPYLSTAHGTMLTYWDGTAHLLLYIFIITLFSIGESYREVGLYWVGSIVNSMVVFLPGNVTGKFEFKWSYLLGVPYIIIPLLAGFSFIQDRPMHISSYRRVRGIWCRPVDLCFVIFYILATCVAVFRGMAVAGTKSDLIYSYLSQVEPYLNDPNVYPKMQVLVYWYYYVFFYISAIYGLLRPRQSWMTDFALLHAGASAQAQFVHIMSSLHHRTTACYHAPWLGTPGTIFWGLNLALVVVPHLFVWRCLRSPGMFGSAYTVETAYPIVVKKNTNKYD